MGILDYGSRNSAIIGNYFENNTGYAIDLLGTDSVCADINIERNFFAHTLAVTFIWVANASIVNIRHNDVNPGAAGTIFVNTPGAGTRSILIDRNRMGVPASVTEYGGDAASLVYFNASLTAGGVDAGIEKLTISNDLILNNAIYLQCKNAAGTPQDVLGIAGDNNLHLYNPAGHVYINPKAGSQTVIGIDNAGAIWLGYHTGGGVLPADIVLDPNAATGTIHLNGPTIHIPSANVLIQTGTLSIAGLTTMSAAATVGTTLGVTGLSSLTGGAMMGADLNLNSKYIDNWNAVGISSHANEGSILVKVGGAVKRVPYFDDA